MNYLYGKEKPITQIKKGIRYLKNPEEIEYKNVFGLNYQENVINVCAAIAKYENCLPEFGFRITYCCESFEENYFGKSNGEYFSGKGITIISDSLSASKSLIFKDNYLGKEIEFSISENDLFEKESIHLNIKKQKILINIYKCKFEPESGFGKLYFNIFNRFIKAKNCE